MSFQRSASAVLFSLASACVAVAPVAPPVPASATATPETASKPASAPATAAPSFAVVEGVVLSVAGVPVEGARVAINPTDLNAPGARAAEPLAALRSGPDGRFRAEVPPQGVALTATAAGVIPALLLKQEASLATPLRVELKLGGPGVLARGRCSSGSKLPLKNLSVRVAKVSEDNGDVFLAQVEGDAFSLTVDPAWQLTAFADAEEHQLAVQAFGPAAEAKLELKERLHDDRQTPGDVVDWIKQNAMPLKSTLAGQGFEDLRPLGAALGDARVIALGEATHGSAEFFQMKHRMLEYLVAEKGVTLFGIEASWPDSLAANHYVLGGPGDPYKVVAKMRFWTWDTEEVVAMVKWMRAWNADKAHRKVQFIGFDMQSPVPAVRALLAYIEKTDPKLVAPARADLQVFANELAMPDQLSPAEHDAVVARVAALLAVFDEHKTQWVKKTSAAAWAEARHMAEIVQQADQSFRSGAVRDRAMAANVLWMLEQAGPSSKAMLWAHNGHVGIYDDRETMGTVLRKRLGKDYAVVGLGFGQGGLQAMPLPFGSGGLREFTTPPPPPGSLDGTFAATGLPLFALELRELPREGPAAEYFAHPHAMKGIGSHYSEAMLPLQSQAPRLPGEYDFLIFVARTTAARASPGSREARPPPTPPLSVPENLDLSQGAVGASPPGWALAPMGFRAGWRATLADGQGCGGKDAPGRCAVLAYDPAAAFLDSYGQLRERLEATPFRGKTLRLRASMRSELTTANDVAQLALACTRDREGTVSAKASPKGRKNWEVVEATLLVPPDAKTCDVSLAAEGEGRVLFGPVQLSAEDPAAPKH